MNASLLTADRGTHLKIALISLTAVLGILSAGLAYRPAGTAAVRSVGSLEPAIVTGDMQSADRFEGAGCLSLDLSA